MKRDLTYKEKFHLLKEWMPSIVESVKKELKNEHLKQDFAFVKRYLPGKNVQKVEIQELADAYMQALNDSADSEEIGEFIATRWIVRHSEIYHYYESALKKINEDMTAIESLTDAQASALIEGGKDDFGYLNGYIFSILNSVVFSDAQLADYRKKSAQELSHKKESAAQEAETRNIEQIKRNCELEVARLTDRYEKKLIGLQKKYTEDVAQLKKQIGTLQRKLTGVTV